MERSSSSRRWVLQTHLSRPLYDLTAHSSRLQTAANKENVAPTAAKKAAPAKKPAATTAAAKKAPAKVSVHVQDGASTHDLLTLRFGRAEGNSHQGYRCKEGPCQEDYHGCCKEDLCSQEGCRYVLCAIHMLTSAHERFAHYSQVHQGSRKEGHRYQEEVDLFIHQARSLDCLNSSTLVF